MVTECPQQTEQLLPGSHKEDNRWQGKVRVGPLDFVTLRYAIDVCGGPQTFSGLAVTWFDQIPIFGSWQCCNRYLGADDLNFFTPAGEIIVHRGIDVNQLAYQQQLRELLRKCRPYIMRCPIGKQTPKDDLIRLCRDVMQDHLHIPVKMISFGPTEKDKICIS